MNNYKTIILILFLAYFTMSNAQKGDFIGFTYGSNTKVIPFTTIKCKELPNLNEQSNKNGYFSLMLDTGLYHFDFFSGDGSKHSGMTKFNLVVRVEENLATIKSVRLEGQMRALRALRDRYYDHESYFKQLDYAKKHLGLNYDSLMNICPEQIEFDNHNYKIINAEIILDGARYLAVDLNLPDVNTASPFGELAHCFIQFEQRGDKREFSSSLPKYALHNGVLVNRFTFNRMTDLKGVEMTVLMAIRPNDSTGYKNAWKEPQKYIWLKRTLVLPGVNSTKQFARDEADRLMKLDSLYKCPENNSRIHESILTESYGVPIYNPKQIYNWDDFAPEFCPRMDSLIEIKFGDDVYKNITYIVFQEDSIKKRKERNSYPEYIKGDSALADFIQRKIKLDDHVCAPLKNILLTVDIEVDEKGKVKYLGSKFRQLNQYTPNSFKNYDSLDCQLIQNEIERLIPLMPKWKPGTDGFDEATSTKTKFRYVYFHNGNFKTSTQKLYRAAKSYPRVCGNWRPPRKWHPHLYDRKSVWKE